VTTPKTASGSAPPLPPRGGDVAKDPADRRRHGAMLVGILGTQVGRMYEIDERQMTIGRSSECDIVVSEWTDASRTPAVRAFVTLGERGVWVREAQPNGVVFVNDRRVPEAELVDGDTLRIARAKFRCLVGAEFELHRAYHREIYRLSTRDPLTALFNKRFFNETLLREVGRAKRYREPLALALLDLDHLKRINDVHGMRAGDEILTTVASVTEAWSRDGDVVARYGGDEIVILLPNHDLEAATDRVDALRRRIESTTVAIDDPAVSVTASIGLAMLDASDDVYDIVKRADRRLFDAKRAGRNRLVYD
jgi:diguanylate cyclase (GGDEF)-like protein